MKAAVAGYLLAVVLVVIACEWFARRRDRRCSEAERKAALARLLGDPEP